MSQNGFTLLECLIALSIMMGLLIFLTPFIQQINTFWDIQQDGTYLELQIGKKQLEHEIKGLDIVDVQPNKLIYSKMVNNQAERVIFDLYEDKLRKQPGFQPIIVGLKTVEFIEYTNVIQMTIVTVKGESYVYFLSK